MNTDDLLRTAHFYAPACRQSKPNLPQLIFWKEPYGLNRLCWSQQPASTMNASVVIPLGWLGIGSLIAIAVLTQHFRTGSRFPRKAGWWLIPVLIIGWPWPVWVWLTNNKTARPARIGLATFTLIGALGLGWGGGLKLYDFLYPKKLEPTDMPALNAMMERLISNPSANNETQIGIPPRLFTFR